MSTPIEIADELTGNSLWVDEYGLVNISISGEGGSASVEIDLPSVYELIILLTKAANEITNKRQLEYERKQQ